MKVSHVILVFHTLIRMSGLFNKEDFRDNCGFGLVANINGIQSHKVVINSIDALKSMTHRGGVGSDGKTGDGCGLLLDIDHNYFKNALLSALINRSAQIVAKTLPYAISDTLNVVTLSSKKDRHNGRLCTPDALWMVMSHICVIAGMRCLGTAG